MSCPKNCMFCKIGKNRNTRLQCEEFKERRRYINRLTYKARKLRKQQQDK